MTLDPILASGVVGATGATVLAWGAAISARSAGIGPEWAVAFLAKSRRVWLGVLVVGLLVGLVAEPRWLGLTVAYIAWVARWMAGRVSTGLSEALALGPYVPPSVHRQLSILYRTVMGLVVAAAVAAGTALIVSRTRIDLTAVALVFAALSAGLAWRLWTVGTEGFGTGRSATEAGPPMHD